MLALVLFTINMLDPASIDSRDFLADLLKITPTSQVENKCGKNLKYSLYDKSEIVLMISSETNAPFAFTYKPADTDEAKKLSSHVMSKYVLLEQNKIGLLFGLPDGLFLIDLEDNLYTSIFATSVFDKAVKCSEGILGQSKPEAPLARPAPASQIDL